MSLVKSSNRWNYKTIDLKPMKGSDYLEQLGKMLDNAGRSGWDICHVSEDYMILKQLYIFTEK